MTKKDWAEELFIKLKHLQGENAGTIDINNIDNIIKQFLEV